MGNSTPFCMEAPLSTPSTVLVEVASDSSSYRYVIESHGALEEQDIARLLLATEQSIQKEEVRSDGNCEIYLHTPSFQKIRLSDRAKKIS